MAEKLFLLDGMALSYRAYFSMIRTPLMNSRGMNTSAVFGFVNSLNKILEDEKPDYIAVAFDTSGPTFRHKMYKEYKATREAMPDDLVPQIDKIKEIIVAYNIPMIELQGYEADDIIGTLVKIAEKQKVLSYMVTPDKDFMQLVNKYIMIYKPSRSAGGSKVTDVEVINADSVKERFGVGPDRITDILALMGDKVDNVPGVKGIGEKTAITLINEFGSLDELYKNIEKVTKPKLKENLVMYKDDAFLSRELVTIDTKIPLDLDFHQLKANDKNLALLEKIFTELEFKSLMKRIIGSSEEAIDIKAVPDEIKKKTEAVPPSKRLDDINTIKHKYYTIKTEDELTRLVDKLNEEEEFAFDTETTSEEPLNAEIAGMSFSYNENEAFYVPILFSEKQDSDLFGKPSSQNKSKESIPSVSLEFILSAIKPLMENKAIRKIGHNIKYDMLVMKEHGINIENVGFDSMIAAYVLKPESQYRMDYLSEAYLNYKCIPITDLIGNGKSDKEITMDKVSYKAAAQYSSEDADVAMKLYHRLEYELKKINLDGLCNDIEFPLIEVLADMEYNGVKIDENILSEMNTKLAGIIEKLEKEIYKLAGEEFNINSTKQLNEILFKKLKLSAVRKIKTGFSTDTRVLEDLKDEHPIAVKLLDYRVVTKLRSTYTEGLLKIINKDTGKVHTSFNQYVAATGRLSSANPNLQNIPIRTEIGRELRKAFVPEYEGGMILSADYSQIELRIMAHLSDDENMIKAFERRHDIHAETASRIFKVKPDKVEPSMRRKAKEVNFGIIYGIQAFGLSSRLEIEQHEAREIIQTYFREYPKISGWLEETKKFAREKGYTETLAGRRRYLPNINNKNSLVRQRDERIAINMPVQGTAADMIKIAMINIFDEFKKEKLKSKMILQVHDELVFECLKEEVEDVERIVSNKMKHAIKLNVPIEVDIGAGENWFDVKKK
ncbi:MAG: DNA polymerase I [Ignavibacteria bacterium]